MTRSPGASARGILSFTAVASSRRCATSSEVMRMPSPGPPRARPTPPSSDRGRVAGGPARRIDRCLAGSPSAGSAARRTARAAEAAAGARAGRGGPGRRAPRSPGRRGSGARRASPAVGRSSGAERCRRGRAVRRTPSSRDGGRRQRGGAAVDRLAGSGRSAAPRTGGSRRRPAPAHAAPEDAGRGAAPRATPATRPSRDEERPLPDRAREVRQPSDPTDERPLPGGQKWGNVARRGAHEVGAERAAPRSADDRRRPGRRPSAPPGRPAAWRATTGPGTSGRTRRPPWPARGAAEPCPRRPPHGPAAGDAMRCALGTPRAPARGGR